MTDINIEQKSTKVADLAMDGQGCSVWDEIKSMDPATISKIIAGAQEKSPNAKANEMSVLPGISTVTSHEEFMGLFSPRWSASVDLVDAKGHSTNILAFSAQHYWGVDSNEHTCKNLPKVGDTK